MSIDLGPFGSFPFFVGPAGAIAKSAFDKLIEEAQDLFGTGEQPQLPGPPEATLPQSPDGQGPAQDRIDELNQMVAELQKRLDELHKAGDEATSATGENSTQGRTAHDQIVSDGALLGSGLAPQGSVPEADSGMLAAMQQQIDELTRNVEDKATTANGIADSLRNMGMGMPGLGGLGGGPGMGMPGLGGGIPGLSSLGGGGMDAPEVSSLGDNDALEPPEVASTSDDALTPPEVSAAGMAAPEVSPGPEPMPATAAPATPAPAPAPTPAEAPGEPAASTSETSSEITLPSGQVVTAPNPQAAAAVRNALNRPAGAGDVATTAYTGTDVELPTDGADPGRKIDPSDVKPGDIVVFDDHTAIVAGNGQLIGPDGKLEPLGIINDSPGFKGFFRPTEDAADLAAPSSATVPAAPTTAAPPPQTTTLSAAVPDDDEPDEAPVPAADPGFGLSTVPPTHER